MVLQRVHQGRRFNSVPPCQVECEANELGIAGRDGMVIGGPVDEVVRKVGSSRGGALDVVDGEVEFLEGEAAHLANHARDQLIRGLR